MGNATTPSHPLPQIWQRINCAFLRHRYTQEIIEEHTVTAPSHDQLLVLIATLKKRIALHHMSIAKVIYFQNVEHSSICTQLHSHQLILYTEYTGDSLQDVVQEKGERMYHTPCQCTHIISAADYLREHHGCFLLKPSMIFLGNRKEKTTKVWVHSKVEISEREFPVSQEEMCQSIADLLKYIKHNKLCTTISDEQLQAVQRMKKMAELKMVVYDMHRFREDHSRVKKANSISIAQSRENDVKFLEERREPSKKMHSVKANSMPQKSQELKAQTKTVQMPQLKGRDLNETGQYYTKILNQNLNIANGYKSQQRSNPLTDLFYRPVQAAAPLRINFMYPQQEKPQIENRLEVSLPQQKKEVSHQVKEKEDITYKISDLAIKNLKENDEKKSIFSPLLGTFAHSVTNSPDAIKLTSDPGNFTAREMELPLPEASEKITPARLPTTSRSPKIAKDIETKSVQKPIDMIPALNPRKIVKLPSKGGQKYEKQSSGNTSGNKFQKYKDAIKNYEQKLRQKLAASSTGSVNPAPKSKNKVMVRKSVSSPKEGEFKQTKSVYNDSDDEPGIPGHDKIKNEVVQKRFASQNNYHTDQSIPERQVEQSNRKQASQKQQESNQKIRQKMQKLQLERQLEKEKQMIHNEMQDLFKQNAMKDEYRSIREKIKQKKQTFAQLKAEATKILEDLDY